VSVFVITIVALLAATLALSIGLMVVALKLRNAASRLAELKKSLRDTRRASANFRTATEHANDGLVIQNMDATIVWANPAYCRIMGRDLDDMIGRNPLEFALPSRERPPKSAIRSFRYNPDDPEFRRLELVRNQRKDGTLFWNQISFAFHTNAAGDQICVVVCRDVSEQIEQEERLAEARDKLEHEATHDALTGLANRTALIRFADQALADAAKTGRQVGMLHVDLDRFKEINDTRPCRRRRGAAPCGPAIVRPCPARRHGRPGGGRRIRRGLPGSGRARGSARGRDQAVAGAAGVDRLERPGAGRARLDRRRPVGARRNRHRRSAQLFRFRPLRGQARRPRPGRNL